MSWPMSVSQLVEKGVLQAIQESWPLPSGICSIVDDTQSPVTFGKVNWGTADFLCCCCSINPLTEISLLWDPRRWCWFIEESEVQTVHWLETPVSGHRVQVCRSFLCTISLLHSFLETLTNWKWTWTCAIYMGFIFLHVSYFESRNVLSF